MDERSYPKDLDGERALLGGLILDNYRISEVAGIVKPGDFYLEAHRKIYAAICGLNELEKPVDCVILADVLETAGHLGEVGGRTYLAGLTDAVPTTTNLLSYADEVRKKSQLRNVLEATAEITEAVLEGRPLADVYRRASKMLEIAEPRNRGSSLLNSEQLIDLLVRHHEMEDEARKLSTHGLVVPTPWEELNRMLNGGWVGYRRYYLVAAREKVGKTQFLIKCVLTALKLKIPVLFFELDFTHIQFVCRLLGLLCRINGDRIDRWVDLTADEIEAASMAMARMLEMPMWLDARGVKRLQGFRSSPAKTVRQMRQRYDVMERAGVTPGLVIVDYVQKMEADVDITDERARFVKISNDLQEWATEISAPMLVMAQCKSREEDRPKVPTLATLSGTSAFAKDCCAGMVLDRPPLRKSAKEQSEMSDAELNEAQIILETREHGQTGIVQVRHDPVCGDWAPVWDPQGAR